MTAERRRYCIHEAAHVVGCLMLGAKIRHAAAPGPDGENQVVHEAVPEDDGSGAMLISLMGVAAEQFYGYRERRGVILPSRLTGIDQDLSDAYQVAVTMTGHGQADDLYRRTYGSARSAVIGNYAALERLADLLAAHDVVSDHQIRQTVRVVTDGGALG